MRASTPGKIILAGEHAVVYGKPALVATVNRRLTVSIRERKDNEIKIFSNESLEQIKEAIKKFEEMYVAYRDRGIQPTYVGGLEIRVKSEVPVKVGMGSSAAVAVAVVGGLLAFVKKLKKFSGKDKELINKIAYEVEKKAHGNPSGIDNTIVTFGGFLWYQKRMPFKRIKLKDLPKFILINTGNAEETTGEMVNKVNSKFQIPNSKFRFIFNEIERQTKRFLLGLRAKNKEEIMRAVKGCENGLEKLGVVGEFAKKVIREIESVGGAAKICGAGGVKDRSGVLLCYHQSPEKIFALAKKFSLDAFGAKLGEEGVRIE